MSAEDNGRESVIRRLAVSVSESDHTWRTPGSCDQLKTRTSFYFCLVFMFLSLSFFSACHLHEEKDVGDSRGTEKPDDMKEKWKLYRQIYV